MAKGGDAAKFAVKQALDIALPTAKEAAEWQAYLNHPDKHIRWEAFKLAMAYRHGKSIQPVSGAPIDSEPIRVEVNHIGASAEFFCKAGRGTRTEIVVGVVSQP